MKIYRKCLNFIVKAISGFEMLLVCGLVGMMLTELCARNFFNKSFRFSTELCGFMFMWMAFCGIIILYDRNGLITLDIVYTHVNAKIQTVFWYISKVVSIGLGAIMITAYVKMYPINSTSYFSTMPISKAMHFLPMALAGGFMILDSIYQLLARIMKLENTEKTEAQS